jgi:hypothetical protein
LKDNQPQILNRMPHTKTGPAVHYGDSSLILRIKTATPAHMHNSLMKGINTALKLSLVTEDVTNEERDSLTSLTEVLLQILPSELALERAYAI